MFIVKKFRKVDALAALALIAAPVVLQAPVAMPVAAHHSAAPFDLTREISLRGTVQRWVWSNPHSWLYIQITKQDGSTEIWGLEAGSTNALTRFGWAARDMRPGDTVTVGAHPARDGGRIGLLSQVRLANGRTLSSGFGPPPSATPSPRG